jgi:hypothetical protein
MEYGIHTPDKSCADAPLAPAVAAAGSPASGILVFCEKAGGIITRTPINASNE